MATDWNGYQEEAAEFFSSLGLQAETNVTLRGARTSHDVDVVVRSRHAGFEVMWVVECKHWKSPISKLHVLGLRQIVTDVGADRGILLAEAGFQSGAAEAASLTNIHLTSLAQARSETSNEISALRLAELYDRVEQCRERYWSIPKHARIEHGLRPDVPESGYSGASVISLAEDVFRRAFRGKYPFELDYMWRSAVADTRTVLASAEEVVIYLEPMVQELEGRLDACVSAMAARENRSA